MKDDQCINRHSQYLSEHADAKNYARNNDFKLGLSMKFHYFNAKALYGIPERESASLKLMSTEGQDPYRLYNADMFEHKVGERAELYGAVPYITGHNLG